MTAQHLASGALWSSLSKVLQLLLTLATLVVVGRFAGPEAFGVFSLVWVVIGLIEQLAQTATSDSLIAQRDPDQAHFSSLFWLLTPAIVVASLAVVLFADPLAHWLGGGPVLAALLVWRACFMPLAGLLGISYAVLAGRRQFKVLARIDMAANTASALLTIGLALAGYGVWSLLAGELARVSLQATLQTRAANWLPTLQFSAHALRELAPRSVQSLAAAALGFVVRTTPRLMIGQTLGSQALGYFAMAERLCEQISKILVLPGYEVVKLGAARAREDKTALRQLLQGAIGASSLVTYPVLLGTAVVAPWLLASLLGNAWLEAVPIVQLMLLASLRGPATGYFPAVWIGMGQAWRHTGLQVFQCVLTVLVCLFAVPYGLAALGMALIARNLLSSSLASVQMRTVLGDGPNPVLIAGVRHGLAAALMALVVLAWTQAVASSIPAGLTLLTAIGLGVVVYPAALAALAPQSFRALTLVARKLAGGERGAFKSYLVAAAAGRR